jgi:hypothetical protein
LKNVEKEESSQRFAWKFVNGIIDGIALHARANGSVIDRMIKGLASHDIAMKALSFIVVTRLVHDKLLSASQSRCFLGCLKTFIESNELKIQCDSELKDAQGNPPITFGNWYLNKDFEKLLSVAALLAIRTIISYYLKPENNYFISSDQEFYNLLMETILHTGTLSHDLIKRFLSKQVAGQLLEFAFGGLYSSLSVLSTNLSIARKFIDYNSKSTNPKDLQVVIAPLLLCLSHDEKSIRVLAVDLLSSLKQSFDAYCIVNGTKQTKSTLYGYGTFYGHQTKDLEFLSVSTSLEFAVALLNRGHDIIADKTHLNSHLHLVLSHLSTQK